MRPLHVILLFGLLACQSPDTKPKIVVLISANAEWQIVKKLYTEEDYQPTPWGEYFIKEIKTGNKTQPVIFFHEGWGKVSAAGATQYAIDQWSPDYLINLGTCGGFEGSVKRYETLLIDQTIIYDIKEAMGDSREAINDYSTKLDLSWISYPDTIRKTLLVSADRDLVPEEIDSLKTKYNAIAGDWETGAIAYACNRNNKKLLILRGVSDLVNSSNGEAYGNLEEFTNGTEVVMNKLLNQLPLWIEGIHN